MNNEEAIVPLLTEIRDNQRSQMQLIESSNNRRLRGVVVALGVAAIGMVLG